MHLLHALFGDPSHVAAKHTLTLKAHQLMASWLRAGEAMMRRLLVIEAAAYAKPNTRPLLRASRPRARKLMHFTAEAPEQWRVNFRCFSSPVCGGSVSARSAMTKGVRQTRLSEGSARVTPSVACGDTSPANGGGKRLSREERCSQPKPRFRSAWPLAERYEALLRIFNDPAAYARRLARQLHATPHRVRELLRTPPDTQHRIDRFDALTAAAESEAEIFNSG